MKDLKGSKAKNNDEIGTEYCSARDFEQLSLILETANFPVAQERRNSSEKEEVELSIGTLLLGLLYLGPKFCTFYILIKFPLLPKFEIKILVSKLTKKSHDQALE